MNATVEISGSFGIPATAMPWEKARMLPMHLSEKYSFERAVLDGIDCLFAEVHGEVPTIQALRKHIDRIRELEAVPVVLVMRSVSGARRKALINARIPFVADGQAYVPFIGAALSERLYEEPRLHEKLMPSAQMLLFAYLYQADGRLYINGMSEKLGVSAMQVTRASRQLHRLGLLRLTKDGVRVVLEGRSGRRELFELAAPHLIDPVREVVFVPRDECGARLPRSGVSALSHLTKLADDAVPTFAYCGRKEDVRGQSVLTDRDEQTRIEIWKYPPAALSEMDGVADPFSVATSLRGEDDERINMAIDEMLGKVWGEHEQ